MDSDKLAGHLGIVSPTLTGALDLLVKHAPKARTLALRYEDRPEAFEGLIAVEAGAAFLPDGAPNPDYQRKLGAFLGRARETLPPHGIPLMVQANEAGGQPDRLTVTLVDEGGTQHRITTRCLWEHRMPLGWWTMLLRTPNGDAAPGDLRLAGPCETLPGLLALARDLRVALGGRPEPAVGAPPWITSNITASTTGRERREAIHCQDGPKMSTDPDKLLRAVRAHVTMATDLAAAIVRAGDRRAATLAAGGAPDLADAVFAIDCLAAHVETTEAMLRATEGDYPAESVARAQRANQRLAEALAEARAGLERGDDPLLVHTRLKIVLAMAAFESEQLRIDTAMRAALKVAGAGQPADPRPVVRVPHEGVVRRDLIRDFRVVHRGRQCHIDKLKGTPVMLDPDAVQAGVSVTADGTPIGYDDTPGVRQCARAVTLSEDDGEP